MIADHDLLPFRRGYYEVLLGFLAREPVPAIFEQVSPGIADRARAAAELNPHLSEGWRLIAEATQGGSPGELAQAAADEFTALFLGPHKILVHPYESYYLTGRFFEQPLADIRRFLADVGIEKEPAYPDPEDALAFELSVVARLIEAQQAAADPDAEAVWLTRQATFLKSHLLVWGPRCAEDIEGAAGSDLFRGVGRLLRGFLEFEREVVQDWGPSTIPTLEQARAALGALGTWRGPLFELPAPGSEPPRRRRTGSPSVPDPTPESRGRAGN